RLREYCVGAVVLWLYGDVVDFSGTDAELIHRDGLDILSVRCRDGHFQAGNANVEERHRRPVDDSQLHSLTAAEQTGPIASRSDPVEEVRIGMSRNIEQIGVVHPHLTPHTAIRERPRHTLLASVRQEVTDSPLSVVEVVALNFEHPVDVLRV